MAFYCLKNPIELDSFRAAARLGHTTDGPASTEHCVDLRLRVRSNPKRANRGRQFYTERKPDSEIGYRAQTGSNPIAA
jgi:hypothetical protein